MKIFLYFHLNKSLCYTPQLSLTLLLRKVLAIDKHYNTYKQITRLEFIKQQLAYE